MSREERKAARRENREAVQAYYRQNGLVDGTPQKSEAPAVVPFSEEWYAKLTPEVAALVRELQEIKAQRDVEKTERTEHPHCDHGDTE